MSMAPTPSCIVYKQVNTQLIKLSLELNPKRCIFKTPLIHAQTLRWQTNLVCLSFLWTNTLAFFSNEPSWCSLMYSMDISTFYSMEDQAKEVKWKKAYAAADGLNVIKYFMGIIDEFLNKLEILCIAGPSSQEICLWILLGAYPRLEHLKVS